MPSLNERYPDLHLAPEQLIPAIELPHATIMTGEAYMPQWHENIRDRIPNHRSDALAIFAGKKPAGLHLAYLGFDPNTTQEDVWQVQKGLPVGFSLMHKHIILAECDDELVHFNGAVGAKVGCMPQLPLEISRTGRVKVYLMRNPEAPEVLERFRGYAANDRSIMRTIFGMRFFNI